MTQSKYADNFTYFSNNLTEWVADGVRTIAADNKYALAGFAGAYSLCGGSPAADSLRGNDVPENGQNTMLTEPCTLDDLIQRAKDMGYSDEQIHVYYPYPDMHMPFAIYSDRRLPRRGELTANYNNYGYDRLRMFNEAAKWDEIIDDGMFAQFANSYLLVLENASQAVSWPVFVKYSDDRAEKYRICTEIYDDADGRRVIKRALTNEAESHILSLARNAKRLDERYGGFKMETGITVTANVCRLHEKVGEAGSEDGHGSIELEFLDQPSLEDKLLELAGSGSREEIDRLIQTFAKMVRYNAQAGVWDIDLIFKNIFVNNDMTQWTIADYEWTIADSKLSEWLVGETSDRSVNADDVAGFIIQRAIYYFIADNPGILADADSLYDVAGVRALRLTAMCYAIENDYERHFQEMVSAGHVSLTDIYTECGGRVLDAAGIAAEYIKKDELMRADVPDVSRYRVERDGELRRFVIDSHGKRQITIHPAACCCFVYIRQTSVKCSVRTNGVRINRRLYAFTNTNPEIVFEPDGEIDKFTAEMYVSGQGVGDSPIFDALVRAYTWKRPFV